MEHSTWVIICFLLVACGERGYQTSDITKLTTPDFVGKSSQLEPPDVALGQYIAENKPPLETHQVLHEVVDRMNGPFGVTRIDWTPELTKVGVKVNINGNANFYYTTHYKCWTSGFFFCKSGSTLDYRFKIRGKNSDEEYVLHMVEGYEREYEETSEEGETRVVTRNRAVVPAGEYTLIFKNVPLETLRYMNLYEDYCASAEANTWSLCNIHTPLFKEERQEQDKILGFFEAHNIESLSRKQLLSLFNEYEKYPKVQQYLAWALYSRVANTNSIETVHAFSQEFSQEYPLLGKRATEYIYSLVTHNDFVPAYEWFIDEYSSSEYSLKAVERIHEKMFADAQALDTVDAYNTFVFNYPSAQQVEQALTRATEIEREIYTNYGVFGFIAGDDAKERKARKLLIRAKQIERIPQDKSLSRNESVGYFIVASRMYELLQQEFDEQDATLRHLESEEFKDFTENLLRSLRNIESQLANIETNTREAARYARDNVAVARRGFSDANSDRALASHYANQHNQWEKNMHFQKYGFL